MSTNKDLCTNYRLPKSLSGIAQLGAAIERRWAKCGHRFECFAEIAAEQLQAAALDERFDEDAVLRWVYRVRRLLPQLDLDATFGEPPVTVWHGKDFLIDLYFWLQPETAIHDHSFAGAFTNLRGESLHVRYDFRRSERVGADVLLGELRVQQTETLTRGAVRPIVAGPRFIHSVWHLERPTITLAVRTARLGPVKRLYSYCQPGFAYPHTLSPPAELQRRRQFVRYLFRREHPQRTELLAELLARARPAELLVYLGDLRWLTADHDENEALHQRLVQQLRARHGTWLDVALRAVRANEMFDVLRWDNLTAVEHRFFVALLANLPRRDEIATWVARKAGARPWAETATNWLCEMMQCKALTHDLGSTRAEIVSCLLRGLSDEETLGELRRTYFVSRFEAGVLRQAIAAFRALPLLQALWPGARANVHPAG
jgi:hypothetical protein